MDNRGLFGFCEMFGFSCSGFANIGLQYYKTFCDSLRSVCSVDFVEKLCKSLRKRLWETRGKLSTKWSKWEFCTKKWAILHILNDFVESFAGGFAQRFVSVKWGVLHIFHRAYYYNY